jgi:hypothetical protein
VQFLLSSRQNKWPAFLYLGVPVLVTLLLWWLSPSEVTLSQAGAALVLAWFPWASYCQWTQGEKREIPLFVLIAAMFWLAYALPLFLSSHNISLVTGRHQLSESAVTESLFLALMGVLALFAGMTLAGRLGWMAAIDVDVPTDPFRWKYLRVILVLGILLRLFVPIELLGAEGRQIIINLETILPAVTFAIFFRYFLRGNCSSVDRILVLGYIAISLVVGISSGWLGSFVGLGVICAAVYVYERRKLPLTAALILLPLILFFQPAKNAFRSKFWRSDSSAGHAERVFFWVSQSWEMWNTAITDPGSEGTRNLADNTLNRLSLLQQSANVMELTPDVVPYQHGALYSYMAVTLIPRFAWPDKPSVNDANHWYQVSYHLTIPRNLQNVSIAVGTLSESYINFGWFGPMIIMFPLGVFLGCFQRVFLRADAGLFFSSLGVVLVPHLIGIESQMAEYVAGLAQQMFIVLLVLLPILKARARANVVPDVMFGLYRNPRATIRSNAAVKSSTSQ